jgi:hypothetical protein
MTYLVTASCTRVYEVKGRFHENRPSSSGGIVAMVRERCMLMVQGTGPLLRSYVP